MEFSVEFWLAVVIALLAVSEALSFVPSIKANGIFQAVVGVLKKIKEVLVK